MANKSLSGTTGPTFNQNSQGSSAESAGNSPLKERLKVDASQGPTDLLEVLEFYFGDPVSTHKAYGAPHRSQW